MSRLIDICDWILRNIFIVVFVSYVLISCIVGIIFHWREK